MPCTLLAGLAMDPRCALSRGREPRTVCAMEHPPTGVGSLATLYFQKLLPDLGRSGGVSTLHRQLVPIGVPLDGRLNIIGGKSALNSKSSFSSGY